MPIDDKYPSNSFKSRERPKMVRVATNTKVRKNVVKSASRSIFANSANEVGSYLLRDVVLPAVKELIRDLVVSGIDRSLYDGGSRGRSAPSTGRYVNYSTRSYNAPREDRAPVYRRSSEVKDVIIETRAEAYDVLEQMRNAVEEYGFCTVADYYDLVGVTTTFTDREWCWENLNGAQIRRVRDGYIVELGRPVPIN